MQRREFIKHFIGEDYKTILKWSVILLVIYVLFFADFVNTPDNIISALKIVGLLFVALTSLFLIVFALNFLLRQLLKLLPVTVSTWLRVNKRKIDFVLTGLLFAYIVYDSITREKYSSLFFAAGYFGISLLFREKETPKEG